MQGRQLFIFLALVGVYSYSIFLIGVFGLLSKNNVLLISLFFILIALVLIRSELFSKVSAIKRFFSSSKTNLLLFAVMAGVNLVGALGPELGFDALWYHLTIPKLYITNAQIDYIPGGLLYYSLMPKLIDLLYVPMLMFGSEIITKLAHFSLGIGVCIVTFKIARLFLERNESMLVALVFYSNLVVGWLSIASYIDLGRALFAVSAIYFFLLYLVKKKKRYFYASSALVGLEMASKIIGISTLIAFVLIILFQKEKKRTQRVFEAGQMLIIPLVTLAPWFLFSYLKTQSILYPFLKSTNSFDLGLPSLNPILFLKDMIGLFMFSPDPISPVYLMTLPLIILFFKSLPKNLRILIYISIISLLVWYFIPQKNSRFVVPYLPIFSVISVYAIILLRSDKLRSFLIVLVYFTIVVSVIYRGGANSRFVPYLLKHETKEQFLSKNLNFEYGDYVDKGNKVKEIVGDNRVLIRGVHNLYYVPFLYDHESWGRDTISYKYILTRGRQALPSIYRLKYKDSLTNTYLYEKN